MSVNITGMIDENIANGIKEIQRLKPSLMGRLIYRLIRPRYDVIKINVDLVFKNSLSEELKKKFIQLIYSHWVTFAIEFLTLPFLSKSQVKKKIILKNEQIFTAQLSSLRKDESILLIAGHYGNFEIAQFSPFLFYNVKAAIVRRNQNNNFFNKIILFLIKKYHLTIINNPFKMVFSSQAQKNKVLILLIDNGMGGRGSKGTIINFFGEPAYTYTLGALLSQHPKIRVLFGTVFRNEHNQHVLEAFLKPDKMQISELSTKTNIMQYYYLLLEKAIMGHPEQWLGWAWKKWTINAPDRYKKQA